MRWHSCTRAQGEKSVCLNSGGCQGSGTVADSMGKAGGKLFAEAAARTIHRPTIN